MIVFADRVDQKSHRGDGKRFVVRADEKLTAFLELEAAIAQSNRNQIVFLSQSASE
jgi:hypothetical protein